MKLVGLKNIPPQKCSRFMRFPPDRKAPILITQSQGFQLPRGLEGRLGNPQLIKRKLNKNSAPRYCQTKPQSQQCPVAFAGELKSKKKPQRGTLNTHTSSYSVPIPNWQFSPEFFQKQDWWGLSQAFNKGTSYLVLVDIVAKTYRDGIWQTGNTCLIISSPKNSLDNC